MMNQLDLSQISQDIEIAPYWDNICKTLQKQVWCPSQLKYYHQEHYIKTTRSSSKTYKFSIKGITDIDPRKQIISKKIRIYPENERNFRIACDASRRAYNLAIAAFKNRDTRTKSELARDIRTQVLQELAKRNQIVPNTLLNMAVYRAWETRRHVIRRRKNKEKCDYNFRRKTDTRQSFEIQRLSSEGPYPQILGPVHLTSSIPPEAIWHQAIVINENGRWYLITRRIVDVPQVETQDLRMASIDPGVRCFLSVFSFDSFTKIGENFTDRIFPLLLKLDKLISKKSKYRNTLPKDYSEYRQVHYDQLRYYDKRIHKIRAKVKDLIEDLHRRSAHWLTENYDILLLPLFQTKEMSSKLKRKLKAKSVRAMLQLSHYKFKRYLKWVARKKGKVVIDVNEAYTSKTDSRTGEIVEIRGSGLINGLDRDLNGARGIFLRVLRQLGPVLTTPV